MSGVRSNYQILNIREGDKTHLTNKDKADVFARSIAHESSDANLPSDLRAHRLELQQNELRNTEHSSLDDRINDPFENTNCSTHWGSARRTRHQAMTKSRMSCFKICRKRSCQQSSNCSTRCENPVANQQHGNTRLSSRYWNQTESPHGPPPTDQYLSHRPSANSMKGMSQTAQVV